MRALTKQVLPSPGIDRVVSLLEAAVISGLSIYTLKRCNVRGEIKIIKLSPRRVGIRLSDLQNFIDARAY